MILSRMSRQGMLDLPQTRRLVGASWVAATLGVALLQMRLFAATWQQGHQSALIVALVSSAWICGAFIGTRLNTPSWLWGYALVGSMLAWWVVVPLLDWRRLPIPASAYPLYPLMTLAGLSVIALGLGWVCAAWLGQVRGGWIGVGERWVLCTSLVSVTVGLVIVWVTMDTPVISEALGLLLLFPLLILEAMPPWRRPLAMPGSLADGWQKRMQRNDATSVAPIRLHISAMPRNWWWRYLIARGRGGLTLYASCLAVMMASMWAVVPTAYAGSLAPLHELGKLPWLLAGQLCALLFGGIAQLHGSVRGVIGLPDRVLPTAWQQHTRWLASVPPLIMAVSLISLGYPTLQSPWQLGISLGCYTVGAMAWGVLLPRLRPTLASEVTAKRHTFKQVEIARILPLRQAEEAFISRRILAIEVMLTILLTPFIGALIDRFTVDGVLVRVGITMAACVGVATIASLVRRSQPERSFERWIGHLSYRTAWPTAELAYQSQAPALPDQSSQTPYPLYTTSFIPPGS
jgi:hypothetical protein